MSRPTTADRQLSRLLVVCASEKSSGILTARRGKLKRLFCIDNGLLAYAVSNVIEDQIQERLIRNKVVSAGDVAGAVTEARRQECRLSGLLVEHQIVTADRMNEQTVGHVRDLLYSTLDWTDGEITFEYGRPNLGNEFTVGLSCVDLLLAYARQASLSVQQIRIRAGAPGSRPALVETRRAMLDPLDLEPAERYVVQHADGTRPFKELVEGSPASAESTWRSIYGLQLAGLLEADRRPKTQEVTSTETVSRGEVLARLKRAEGADHYTILELNPTAAPAEIRDAYYFLARRYHPDRFHSGELQPLLGRIESYFTQVTEAYNTLVDPERREEYDALRSAAESQQVDQDTGYLARQNFLRARELIEKGRYTDAVTSLENAIKLDDTKAPYYLELGQLLARNPRRRKEAEDYLLQASRVDPALVESYLALGNLYEKTERTEDAARMFREVVRWEPGHLEAIAKLKQLGDAASGGLLKGLFRG